MKAISPFHLTCWAALCASIAAAPAPAATWSFDLRGYEVLSCQPLFSRGGFDFSIEDGPCGPCVMAVSSGGAALHPALLLGQVSPEETEWTGVEIDLVEFDPGVTATLSFAREGEEFSSVSVSETGESTLRLDRDGGTVDEIRMECCDCFVEEIRLLDARSVGSGGATLTVLKARYR